jgi:CRP/FNR family transcriptional regulator, anaerobic regulatory protein
MLRAALHNVMPAAIAPASVLASTGLAPSCSTCYLRGTCLPSGSPAEQVIQISTLTRTKLRLRRGAALYRRGDVFESVYAIRSGSFKSLGLGRAEHTKVVGLHLPADLVGLEAISSRIHEYDAVALEDSEVCVVPYEELVRLTLSVPELQAYLLAALSREIVRDDGLVLQLGAMTAGQRVTKFLLGLSARYERLGYTGTRFDLRMTRKDIASYLGLTLETVTRVFARLQREGLIQAHLKELRLMNVNGLREVMAAGNTASDMSRAA